MSTDNEVRIEEYTSDSADSSNFKTLFRSPCPCLVKHCQISRADYFPWSCSRCEANLLFEFGNYVRCLCGRAEFKSLKFKCARAEHGDKFLDLPEDISQFIGENIKLELNVVVIGESGVGKSTWINGLANYFQYKTLDEAKSKGARFPIQVFFTLSDPETYEPIEIKIGEDENERYCLGETATRKPKLHQLIAKNVSLNIMDTPGICGNHVIDEISFKDIRSAVSGLTAIHGICILLTSNSSLRMDNVLQSYITELFSKLPREALSNVVFCFTKTRTDNPVDCVPLLRNLLPRLFDSDDVWLTRYTMYWTDNEAVRYLAADESLDNNHLEKNKQKFEKSWNDSTTESARMVEYLLNLEPCILYSDSEITAHNNGNSQLPDEPALA